MEDLDLLILIVTQNNKIVCLNRFKGVLNNDFIDKGKRYMTRNRKTKGLEWVSCGFDHTHNLVFRIYMSTLRSGPIKKWTWHLKYRYTCILESSSRFLTLVGLAGIHVGKRMLVTMCWNFTYQVIKTCFPHLLFGKHPPFACSLGQNSRRHHILWLWLAVSDKEFLKLSLKKPSDSLSPYYCSGHFSFLNVFVLAFGPLVEG